MSVRTLLLVAVSVAFTVGVAILLWNSVGDDVGRVTTAIIPPTAPGEGNVVMYVSTETASPELVAQYRAILDAESERG